MRSLQHIDGSLRARLATTPRFVLLALIALAGCSASSEPAAGPTVDVASSASPSAAATDEAAPAETATPADRPAADAPAPTASSPKQPTSSTPPAAATVSSPSAPSGNAALAEQLFDEGRKAIAAGDYATACAKFDASLKLDFGLGTLFNLADCTERAGDRTRACSLFAQAVAEAQKVGQTDRANLAQTRRTKLGCSP